MPVLEHDGHTLTESLVVAEYIAEAFAERGTPLMPPGAAARAAARLAIELSPFSYFPILRARDDADAKAAALAELEAALGGFDALLREKGAGDGPFMFDDFSLVEAALAPFAQRMCAVLPALAGVEPRALMGPRLARWCDAVLERESVRESGVADDELRASTTAMLARFAAAEKKT